MRPDRHFTNRSCGESSYAGLPIEVGGHGHGCGHNLLGSATLLTATAVRDWLAARVRYYAPVVPGAPEFSQAPSR
jgi:hypothetical protein